MLVISRDALLINKFIHFFKTLLSKILITIFVYLTSYFDFIVFTIVIILLSFEIYEYLTIAISREAISIKPKRKGLFIDRRDFFSLFIKKSLIFKFNLKVFRTKYNYNILYYQKDLIKSNCMITTYVSKYYR